ncbi:MAG: TIM barrel protein [Candidatus Korarchaeum sp.]|nr:TIM barrel protein [Candidatus Korarchaeum sp.]MDW8035001.1 TIM barrel protein [Candidatus Korarchaeum sp.]
MILDRTRFGPAGYPIGAPKERVFSYLREIGLDAMEYQAVRTIPKSEDVLVWIREGSERNDILLSLHAPYAINLCSKEKGEASARRIVDSAIAAAKMGAFHVTFHPGYYGGMSKEESLKLAINQLEKIREELKAMNLNIELGPETTGKPSQLGSLDEVLSMAEEVDGVSPTVDFAHIHAREGGIIRSRREYERLLDEIERRLGYLNGLVIHFTEVELAKSGVGERMHHDIGSNYGPPYEPLADIMAEYELKWVVISESPILEKDSVKMRSIYEEALRRSR